MPAVFVPRRLREHLGLEIGEPFTAAAFNRAIQQIGCTHLQGFYDGEVCDDAINHLLDEHLYVGN